MSLSFLQESWLPRRAKHKTWRGHVYYLIIAAATFVEAVSILLTLGFFAWELRAYVLFHPFFEDWQ